VIGCVVNAGAMALWLTQIQAQPAYLTHLLPAQLLGGAGVGLTIPSLLAAGSLSLTPDRFGTGSGVLASRPWSPSWRTSARIRSPPSSTRPCSS
jgi:hypothetical protein